MADKTGAQHIVSILEELGVDNVFGYTGGSIVSVFDALGKSSITLTINSNEQSAAFSAGGYSRTTDKVGVAIVTSGPAITNALTAIADCYTDSVPLLVFSGQVPEHKLGTDAFQHVDVESVCRGVVKRVIRCTAADLQRQIRDAYHFARSGKPGPVVLDLPVNVQNAVIAEDGADPEVFVCKYQPHHVPSQSQCEEFFVHLKKAQRPLLYIGGGANNERASQALRAFQEKFSVPFVHTLMGNGVIDGTRKECLGMLGMFGTPAANTAIQESDFFIAIGVRWDDRVSEKVGQFGAKAEIAYVDINPEKVQQIREERGPVFSFCGDAGDVIETLAESHEAFDSSSSQWHARVQELNTYFPLAYKKSSDRIQQAHVLDILSQKIRNHDVRVATGVGNHQMLSAQYLRMRSPRRFATSGSFGTMGFGMPTAVGIARAHPESMTIVVDGDGSFRMNMGELHTILQYDLPVKILLLNNHGDGMVRNLQNVLYGEGTGVHTGTTRPKDVDFAQVAAIMGFAFAERVTDPADLDKAVSRFLDASTPAFLEVITDPDEAVYPKVAPGQHYSEMQLGPFIRWLK
ncbi:MAG: thiamine pyrophosphate-binding protein [Nanoarchaeota archaeon]